MNKDMLYLAPVAITLSTAKLSRWTAICGDLQDELIKLNKRIVNSDRFVIEKNKDLQKGIDREYSVETSFWDIIEDTMCVYHLTPKVAFRGNTVVLTFEEDKEWKH